MTVSRGEPSWAHRCGIDATISDDGKTWTVKLRKGMTFESDRAFKGAHRQLISQDAFIRSSA